MDKPIAASLGLALLLQCSASLAASAVRIECSTEQTRPGRALVCEYSMLGQLNEEFAELHDRIILAGREGSGDLKVWVSARDSCKDVGCLDRLFEAGIREAQGVLAEVDSRQAAPILTNARGVELRIIQKSAAAPEASKVVQEEVSSRSAPETAASMVMILFFAAVAAYTFIARRLAA